MLDTIRKEFDHKICFCISIEWLSKIYNSCKKLYITLGFILLLTIYFLPVIGITIALYWKPSDIVLTGLLSILLFLFTCFIICNFICAFCVKNISNIDQIKLIKYAKICELIKEIELDDIITTNPSLKKRNLKTLYFLQVNVEFLQTGFVNPITQGNISINELNTIIQNLNAAYQNIESLILVLQNS